MITEVRISLIVRSLEGDYVDISTIFDRIPSGWIPKGRNLSSRNTESMVTTSNIWRAVLYEGPSVELDAALSGVLKDLPELPACTVGIEAEIDCLIVVSTDNQRISLDESTLELCSNKRYGLSIDIYLSQDGEDN